jgi:hypothetical protein
MGGDVMTGIINQRLQSTVWVSLVVLMALALGLLIQREEEMVMLLTMLIAVIMVGLVMPLFWIVGTAGTITYVGLNRMSAAFKEGTVALDPHLGFTMADGGEPVDEKKK